MSDAIQPQKLTRETPSLRIEYDGWQDRVRVGFRAAHSNQKETRWYTFRVPLEGWTGRGDQSGNCCQA